jgi:hypothetical protein
MGDNIHVSKSELKFIRGLKDFDLTMILSEINDHGWIKAKNLMPLIRKTLN